MTAAQLIEARLAEAKGRPLESGGHPSWEHGACAVEELGYKLGQPWGDHPPCVSPVLASFLRSWNGDWLELAGRTGGDGGEEARAWMVTDWLVRVCAPAWLELAGVTESAALRALPSLTAASVATAQPTLEVARSKGAAARDAARAAAGAAAGGAAAGAALESTTVELQASAVELLRALVAPAEVAP